MFCVGQDQFRAVDAGRDHIALAVIPPESPRGALVTENKYLSVL